MGKKFAIIKPGVRGVDGASDPLTLGDQLRHAVNLQFQSGRLMTRPPFDYMKTGLQGKFQGAVMFRPSLGISFRPFGPCGSQLATAVSGKFYLNNAPASGVVCKPVELKNPDVQTQCGAEVDTHCTGDVNLFQAENILVIQSLWGNTLWWTGEGDLVSSPGMTSDNDQKEGEHSNFTFRDDKHKNFLINGAGLGIFWNGMIHQQGPYGLFVGDPIHNRGNLGTSDIVLMEEQSLQDPLSTNSRMGSLIALEGVPQMGTANGEGALIGYYDGGIVEYNTFQFPRLSQPDAEGKPLVEGWDKKQMVKHNCNTITATGRYAVGVLPRDHFFRSGFGIHVLSRVLGVEFINDEPVNIISDEVSHILNEDDPNLLHGAAAGCWFKGHRWFMTTDFDVHKKHSTSPMGNGFVSWNKVWTKTEDRTPRPVWEGVWTVDDSILGIHRFIQTGMRDDRGCFGFLCSDPDRNIWFAALRREGSYDVREKENIPIPWALETGRFNFGDTTRTKVLVDGRLEGVFYQKGTRVKVYFRTDKCPEWSIWKTLTLCERELKPDEGFEVNKELGRVPEGEEEATWFEFRIEGTGAAEITGFDVEISEGSDKMNNTGSRVIKKPVNAHPLSVAV